MVELYTQASSVNEPRSHTEALRSPQSEEWKNAEAEEITSLENRGTWEVVPRPKGVNVVSCKWVYRVKYGANGEVTCYKAQLIARGFTQIHGLDYSETFAPVTRLETLRLLLGIAVKEDWEVRQIDVKNTYLYGDLDEEIFMDAPQGYDVPEGHVLLLKKALYGLKQAICQEHGIFRTFSFLFYGSLLVLPPPHVLFSQFHSSKKRQDACY